MSELCLSVSFGGRMDGAAARVLGAGGKLGVGVGMGTHARCLSMRECEVCVWGACARSTCGCVTVCLLSLARACARQKPSSGDGGT